MKEIVYSPSLPIKLKPQTVFITGAGLSVDPPSYLPIGNSLTRTYLEHALGDYFDSFVAFWNENFPPIEHFVHDGTWEKLDYKSPWTVYPRLEFIIGEMDKLDKCFEKVPFNTPEIRQKYFRGSSISALRNFANISPNRCHYWMARINASIFFRQNICFC